MFDYHSPKNYNCQINIDDRNMSFLSMYNISPISVVAMQDGGILFPPHPFMPWIEDICIEDGKLQELVTG